jgi:hypothetical protein
MEQIDGSETSACINQTPGIHPKDCSQYPKHGESLKSRNAVCFLCGSCWNFSGFEKLKQFLLAILLNVSRQYNESRGRAVAQLVEAVRYKPEVRGFHSRCCHWNFSLT